MPAPNDLEDLGYGRGQLRPAPAASLRRLDVLMGNAVDVNSAYRDWNEQMRAYLAWMAYKNGRGPWAPRALHPDESWHCKGLALDTDWNPSSGVISRATWKEHGWAFEVGDEPWHGQYYTSLDKHYGEPAGGGSRPFPTPTPTPEEEEDMQHRAFLMATSINDVPNGPFNRWSCDAVAGTKRNIDAAEWEFQNKTLGIQEVNPGIQPSDRLNSYRQIW